ncbi:MAG: 1-phosphofructokinase family hexose kinase, partial [Ferruginibacter sp.]|nr:1-phosphofructokinase family hexose kinase [Ferruginibacter sp.]
KCTATKLEPGGGGINVARAIKKLGGNATAIFPSGGYTGKYFNHLLEIEDIHAVIIETQNETRENIIVLDEAENAQYRFGMPGTHLLVEEWQQCLKAVQEIKDVSYIIASGSLPPGVPLNICAQLSVIAKEKNAKFIVDASGEALKEAWDEGVYLLKPNLGELCFLAGKANLQPNEIETVAKEMVDKGKCEAIVVSMGAEGAMLVTTDLTKIIKAPSVTRKSTVGAGDSMLAGIVYLLSKGKNIEDAVKYGVACGTAATMNEGTELCRLKDVEEIYRKLSEKIMAE